MSTSVETILLDTDVLTDLMRNPQGAAHASLHLRLQQVQDLRVLTSVVVDCAIRFGLLRKASVRMDKAYEDLLQVVEVAPLEPDAVAHYSALRLHLERMGQPIGPHGMLIAAHALALDATLVSADAGFGRVPGLRVENWLQAA